ncbi:MAG: hypothetical protein GXP31_18715 [Kiritimatiellaeota bacterium]|nr:hypothetical protein [Kiritimatiellota bacterium]
MKEPAADRSTGGTHSRGGHRLRLLTAVAIGLVGSILIWVAAPYNNFVIGSSYITDSYLPIASLFLGLFLVLLINPLLRRFAPRFSLRSPQLAVAFGMLLMASVLPGQGLLRMLPYTLARIPADVRDNRRLAEMYEKMDLPPSLFPDKIGFAQETPVSTSFLTELPPGQSIPWSAWLPPLVSWGTFLLFYWLMLIGLAMIVLPQWRHNERLPFPLLGLEQSMIETPEAGHWFSRMFRYKSFWIAAGAVLLLHVLAGWKQYNPDGVPAIPLNWDLSRLFTEEPLVYLPGYIKRNRIYFIFVGMAFFMPSRIGFSIWFFVVAYAAYIVIGRAYFPPFYYDTIGDHRMGGMLALTVAVVWLGRSQWARVLRLLVRRAHGPEDERDQRAGWMFFAGCAGMFFWMVWIGVQPGWALFFVAFGFMVSLLITRIVAETGMPFIRIDCGYRISLVKLVPMSWLNPVSLYFSTAIAMFFPTASRVSACTMAAHAVGLDRDASPKRQVRFALGLVALLLAGLVICGAVNLAASYHHSMTLDGREQPISSWGTNRMANAHRDLIQWQSGRLSRPVYNQKGHILFGIGLASALEWACLAMPRWPLHPIGLIMVNTFYANEAWVSVFFGWLVKVLLLRYGGAPVPTSSPRHHGVDHGRGLCGGLLGAGSGDPRADGTSVRSRSNSTVLKRNPRRRPRTEARRSCRDRGEASLPEPTKRDDALALSDS